SSFPSHPLLAFSRKPFPFTHSSSSLPWFFLFFLFFSYISPIYSLVLTSIKTRIQDGEDFIANFLDNDSPDGFLLYNVNWGKSKRN
ncbi:hypothetical protein Tsubulata_050794, partial [Turnera subulata]